MLVAAAAVMDQITRAAARLALHLARRREAQALSLSNIGMDLIIVIKGFGWD